MDVTLVNAPVTLRNEHARLSPPLGLAYIGSALRNRGFSVSAIDFNVSGLNPRRVDSMLSIHQPSIVGISTTTETWNVLTATGSCPYRCLVCSAASLWKGRRRMRSPQSIIAELSELLAVHGVDRVFFTDDIFTLNRRWVRASVAAGVDAVCSFMIPFPEDTHETLAESLAFMREIRDEGARIYLSYTSPYPGTYFHDNAEELGIRILTDRWDGFDAKHVVIDTRTLTAAEIRAAAESMAAELGMRRSAIPA